MGRFSRTAALLAAIAAVAGVMLAGSVRSQAATTAPGTTAAAARATVCFLFQDIETEFWAAGIKSINRQLKTKGWKVLNKNSQADANKQLEQARDCISQKVDGIIIIPQDGQSVLTIIGLANKAKVPIAVFNRPPAEKAKSIVTVANNESISRQAVSYLASLVKKQGKKIKPLIMVGDLSDPNAVGRKKGFDAVIKANPNLFEKPVEVATKWDAETGRAGLQSAMQANPDVQLIFTSSDFLYPQIKSVLEPLGKWKKRGDKNHIFMAGIDGDSTACRLMKQGYVDATGVQNLFFEAKVTVQAIAQAIQKKQSVVTKTIDDKGFALTAGNLKTRAKDMWGCVIPPPKTTG